MRNNEAKCVVVEPLGVERERTTRLYLGMHFVNSACDGLLEGTVEGNCIVGEDGCVTACKKIPPHRELLLAQNAEGKLDKETRERKQDAAKRKAFLDIETARKRRNII
jgi:hypothetical protein